jgi:menaquinone-specific isochorismate synthase
MLEYEDTIAPGEMRAALAVRRRLVHRVKRAFSSRTNGSAPHVVRLVVDVGPVDPFAWLHAQPAAERLYWSGRNGEAAVAAVGAAEVLRADAPSVSNRSLDQHLRMRFAHADNASCALRYYGGWAFDPVQPLENGWDAFGTYRFVLPRFELRTTGEQATLICNLVRPHDEDRLDAICAQVERLAWPATPPALTLPSAAARTDRPDQTAWRHMVARALDAIAANDLQKVVLARQSVFDFIDALAPVELLRRLHATTSNCFHFMIQPRDAIAFVGASPERLFRRVGRRVQTEAIAGTRSRGDSAQTDAALRNELLESKKDRREHAYVVRAIRDHLAALCTSVHEEASASELRLARGRHLRSQFEGRLQDGVTTLDVLRTLHPTPAIGGVPTEKALQSIRMQEPFARGWYAGPVGWIGPDDAEFAVAIRSGLVRDNTLTLYSGAGIVDGSVPGQEWDEIEQKISDFAAVLDLTS